MVRTRFCHADNALYVSCLLRIKSITRSCPLFSDHHTPSVNLITHESNKTRGTAQGSEARAKEKSKDIYCVPFVLLTLYFCLRW